MSLFGQSQPNLFGNPNPTNGNPFGMAAPSLFNPNPQPAFSFGPGFNINNKEVFTLEISNQVSNPGMFGPQNIQITLKTFNSVDYQPQEVSILVPANFLDFSRGIKIAGTRTCSGSNPNQLPSCDQLNISLNQKMNNYNYGLFGTGSYQEQKIISSTADLKLYQQQQPLIGGAILNSPFRMPPPQQAQPNQPNERFMCELQNNETREQARVKYYKQMKPQSQTPPQMNSMEEKSRHSDFTDCLNEDKEPSELQQKEDSEHERKARAFGILGQDSKEAQTSDMKEPQKTAQILFGGRSAQQQNQSQQQEQRPQLFGNGGFGQPQQQHQQQQPINQMPPQPQQLAFGGQQDNQRTGLFNGPSSNITSRFGSSFNPQPQQQPTCLFGSSSLQQPQQQQQDSFNSSSNFQFGGNFGFTGQQPQQQAPSFGFGAPSNQNQPSSLFGSQPQNIAPQSNQLFGSQPATRPVSLFSSQLQQQQSSNQRPLQPQNIAQPQNIFANALAKATMGNENDMDHETPNDEQK